MLAELQPDFEDELYLDGNKPQHQKYFVRAGFDVYHHSKIEVTETALNIGPSYVLYMYFTTLAAAG